MENKNLDSKVTKNFVEETIEKDVVPNLSEYIRIDNLSRNFDPEWQTNGKLEKAANFLLNWALNFGVKGLKGELVTLEGFTPVIFLEIDGDINKKSAFMYGHYDKQPHFTQWGEGLGPTTPVRRGDLLYGRGGADDGYAIFSSLLAIKNIQNQGLTHGKVTILIEGSEESGSKGLTTYVSELKNRIGTPSICVCLDSAIFNYDRLWILSSLRGGLTIDLKVEVLKEAVHSGSSGLAPDSFMILRNLLNRIEDCQTGVLISDFNVKIPETNLKNLKKCSEILGDSTIKKVSFIDGVQPLHQDNFELILNNTWRSALVVTGASGFPEVSKAGNVLRASTTFRISIRLPPTLDPNESAKRLVQIMTENPPFNAKIDAKVVAANNGWSGKDFSEKLIKSLNEVSELFFDGKDFCQAGSGGSIPFLKDLNDLFPQSDFVVTGVLGPGSNAHSINECLNVDYTKKLTCSVSHVLANEICY